MKRLLFGILLVPLLMGLCTLSFKVRAVKAATIIVPDDYPTIQEAVNHASEGDTVFVRSGTYSETVTVNKTVALIGEDRETTTVDMGIIIEANKVTLSDFTVRNDPGTDETDHGIWLKGSNCLISNNIVKDCALEGILLDGRNGVIRGNIVVNNSFLNNADGGIFLWSCNDSLIESNVANGNYLGIGALASCRNSIENNQVSNNTVVGIMIELNSSANFVINNTVLNNGWGYPEDYVSGILVEYESVSNLIVSNNLTGNIVGLFETGEANNNTIYHNSFVKNGVQVINYDPQFPCVNVWDNGYPSGGNYWSDYAGNDLFGGPHQNLTGSDGIGDTSYILDANNTDRYPLMKPFNPLPGDINEDNSVNMTDLVAVLDAFGSYPGNPRWSPIADANGDGRVDMADILNVLVNFGHHQP